ncbi:Mechanosensitive ion channel protein 1, mitochondrial [Linum perenne]
MWVMAAVGSLVVIGWILKDVWHSATNAFNYTTEKAKETSDALTPHVQHVLDSYPYLKTVVVPVSYILVGTVFAWVVIPKLLRTFQRFSMQSPGGVLYTSIVGEVVPYDKSVWGALEDPVRYLITFMAFSQMANIISRAMASHDLEVADREKWLTFDKIFSTGLFVIGLTACAEAFGVAVQSILTVGGIGGVATAFAARDVLGNVLSGLSIQASKPFSLGDTIKAGSIEGEVIEMGLTTTMLRNSEKFPVIVPNSLFSSQVIVNKSRARFRAMVKHIPVVVDDVHNIGKISTEIESMLKSNPKVFSLEEKEKPYCFLSRIESSFAELTLGCNLNHMSKYECYNAEQEILLESARIIKENGAKLGST